MTERRALSEVLDKYAGLSSACDSNWQQGEKVSAVPSAALLFLGTHQPDYKRLWLDRHGTTLKTKLLALQRPLARLGKLADQVISARADLEHLDEDQLAAKLADLGALSKLTRNAQSARISAAHVQAMAGINEAIRRVFGFRPHREQIIGAFAILEGSIAEMATGEGKTLTANLSAIAAAWQGMPVHVITANDYLAARDCELGQDLYAYCGVTAASVTGDTPPDARAAGYNHEIVYCTARDMLADHLRDSLILSGKTGLLKHALAGARNGGKGEASGIVMRGVHQVIVDEADSVLIDEAVTPLIISTPKPDELLASAAVKAVELARALTEDKDYTINQDVRNVELTRSGRARVAKMVLDAGPFWQRRDRAEELVNTALYSMNMMVRDKHYIIQEGKLVLVDELTGRLARERTLSLGMQQVLEAALDIEVSPLSEVSARLSFQRYFQRLTRIGGMTGTAKETKAELGKIYGLGITAVPTHKPSQRRNLGYRVFASNVEKLHAIVQDACVLSAKGRAVLIGVKSVLTSDDLSAAFALGAPNQPIEILNAINDAQESAIVARAGKAGAITVATNMAGRGTDIKIESDVRDTGGLYVIIAETNDFSRIDRQLIGRCARQGDPGAFMRYVALDEDVVMRFLPSVLRCFWIASFRTRIARQMLARLMLYIAQKRAEHLAYKQRKVSLENEIETEKSMI